MTVERDHVIELASGSLIPLYEVKFIGSQYYVEVWSWISTKRSLFFCVDMPSLSITVINAFDLRETEFFGSRQDPYVIVRSDVDTRQTGVHMDGGRNPGSF